MKTKLIGLLAAALLLPFAAFAQEHMTQGPVWQLASYQINDGQFDNYMNYLRKHSAPLYEARKKAGLIMDYKFFFSDRANPNDADLTVAVLMPSAAKAFDYSAADDAAGDEIAKKHWAAWSDETARKAEQDSRFAMRRFISNSWVREVTLKPAK